MPDPDTPESWEQVYDAMKVKQPSENERNILCDDLAYYMEDEIEAISNYRAVAKEMGRKGNTGASAMFKDMKNDERKHLSSLIAYASMIKCKIPEELKERINELEE